MRVLKFDDDEFPQSLKSIQNPPSQLWVEGDVSLLSQNAIAIVGSRGCTEYGKRWCENFTKDLLEYNLVIVSGMAIGIDTIAHNTALKYGGKTIAVLPSGFDNVYPKRNFNLFQNIINNGGVVVSEYSPLEEADQEKFLERNRLVSGLSVATLVIEAAYRSGTSVTANITKSENKEVFCVPGSLDNSKSLGTNIMIKKGAKLVTCVDDIVENYGFLHKDNVLQEVPDLILEDVDDEYKDVYKIISNVPIDINQISKKANISINEAMAKVSMLEIDGKIKRFEGSKFVRG
jgi:DNA processing protein